MTKVWTESDVDFALQSCWRAFEETMKANEMTEEEISKFITEISMRDVYQNVRESFTISLGGRVNV